MSIKEVEEAIEILKKEGNSDNDIAKSFYLMYLDDKINMNQLKALLTILNYCLPKEFWEEEKEQQIRFFMDKCNQLEF